MPAPNYFLTMRQTVQFGEWLPDQPSYGLQGSTVVTNVLPDFMAYKSMPGLQIFSTALGSRCLGGIYATDPGGNNYNYAGDTSALYSLSQQSFSTATRTVGGAYSTLGDDGWEFTNWGNTVIACNGHTDPLQQISLGATNFVDLSVGVKASHIATIRDFVVLGNVSDSATNVYRVRWSADNNPADFVPNIATLSDYQDLPSEGGPIQRIISGEYGVIFQRRRITRMLFIGAPIIFQFDPIHEKVGALSPRSIASYQNLVFFLSDDGFYALENASQLEPIGRGKVDNFFFADASPAYTQRVTAAIDPNNKLVMWSYASNDNPQGNANKMLVYSWAYQKWTLITGLNIEYILSSATTGYTLEGLDAISTNIDALPVTLDSVQWTGGQVIISAYDGNHQLGRFNGSAMAASITTGEFEMFDGQLARITEVRPLVIGLSASLTVTVVNRNNLTESLSVGAASVGLNATGFAPVRVTSRYQNIHVDVTGNFKQMLGVEVVGIPDGVRYK